MRHQGPIAWLLTIIVRSLITALFMAWLEAPAWAILLAVVVVMEVGTATRAASR